MEYMEKRLYSNVSWQEKGKEAEGGEAIQKVTPRPRSPCQKCRP